MEVIKLRLELIIKRFAIRRISDWISLSLVLIAILVGIKIGQFFIPDYENLQFLIIITSLLFLGNNLKVKNLSKFCKQSIALFPNISIQKVRRYYLLRNFIAIYIIITYLQTPTRVSQINSFIIFQLCFLLLVFLILLIEHHIISKYKSISKTILYVLVYATLFLKIRKILDFRFDSFAKFQFLPIIFIGIAFLFILNIKLLLKEVRQPIFYRTKTRDFFKNKNMISKSFIYITKKPILVEIIASFSLLLIMYGTISNVNGNDFYPVFSAIYSYSMLQAYIALISDDNKRYYLIYGNMPIRKYKLRRCIAVVALFIPIFICSTILLQFFIPLVNILLSIALGLLAFFVTIFIDIIASKSKKMLNFVTIKKQFMLYILLTLLHVIMYIILEV